LRGRRALNEPGRQRLLDPAGKRKYVPENGGGCRCRRAPARFVDRAPVCRCGDAYCRLAEAAGAGSAAAAVVVAVATAEAVRDGNAGNPGGGPLSGKLKIGMELGQRKVVSKSLVSGFATLPAVAISSTALRPSKPKTTRVRPGVAVGTT
jgi:hypothetical protein